MGDEKMTPARLRDVADALNRVGHVSGQPGAVFQMSKMVGAWAEQEEKALDDDSGRPYWMWHAMLSALAERACDLEGCESADLCITEWCLPCAARAFLRTGADRDEERDCLRMCLAETNEALKVAGFPTVRPTPGPAGDEGISPADQVAAMAGEIELARMRLVACSEAARANTREVPCEVALEYQSASFNDVRAAVEREMGHRAARETAEKLVADKSKFIAILSHELELPRASHSEEEDYIKAIRDLKAEVERVGEWQGLYDAAPEKAKAIVLQRMREAGAVQPIVKVWKDKVAELESQKAERKTSFHELRESKKWIFRHLSSLHVELGIAYSAEGDDVHKIHAAAIAALRELKAKVEAKPDQVVNVDMTSTPDKVIEVDLADPSECIFCDYEQGFCHADKDHDPNSRSCVRGSASDPANAEAPPWCHARGRVIVQAKDGGKS